MAHSPASCAYNALPHSYGRQHTGQEAKQYLTGYGSTPVLFLKETSNLLLSRLACPLLPKSTSKQLHDTAGASPARIISQENPTEAPGNIWEMLLLISGLLPARQAQRECDTRNAATQLPARIETTA